MPESASTDRRRQFCTRCGQLMFEYFRSPDGHFGLLDDLGISADQCRSEIRCRTCGARYRLLDRLSPTGQPMERQ